MKDEFIELWNRHAVEDKAEKTGRGCLSILHR